MDQEKRIVTKIDLDKDLNASVKRLEELKAGRHIEDIPLSDEYWRAIKKHREAHKL